MKPETISAIAAVIAVSMAVVSWHYNKEITKGKLSLYDVKVVGDRPQSERLKINFTFLFKNIGHHALEIQKLQLGHYNFQTKIFANTSKPLVMNDIYPESIFNYSTSFLTPISPKVTNKEIGSLLPTIAGKHCIVLIVKYKIKALFSFKTHTIKSYFGYDGHGAVYQLTLDEYNLMEQYLPEEFKK